jgi:hypothetical protein
MPNVSTINDSAGHGVNDSIGGGPTVRNDVSTRRCGQVAGTAVFSALDVVALLRRTRLTMRNSGISRAMFLATAVGMFVAILPARAAAQDGPFQFHSLTPCRVANTRTGTPSPLTDQEIRTFPVQQLCGVPQGARAVAVNLTAVGPAGTGYLTLFPTGITRPVVSTLNYSAGEPALANGAIVPLADQLTYPNDLSVFAKVQGGGTVHVLIDVTGYFE